MNIVETKATDILSSDSRRLFTKKSFGSTRTIVDSRQEEYDAIKVLSSQEEHGADSLSLKVPISRLYSQQIPDTVSRPQQQTQTGLKSLQRREVVSDSLLMQQESGRRTSQWGGYSSKQNLGVEDKDMVENNATQIEASRDVRWQNNCYLFFNIF